MMNHKPFSLVSERTNHRPARFAGRLHEELSQLIPGALKDPRLNGIVFITLTNIELSPDLRNAKISFSLMQEESRAGEVEAALNSASNYLRKKIMENLDTKTTPHLSFKFDKNVAYAAHMSGIIFDATKSS